MQLLRADTRRARDARAGTVARPAARRTRAGVPLLLAPITVGLTAITAALLGGSLLMVLLLTAGVALAGALVAHRTVANLFAGLMLLLARPFAPGDRLRLYVPEFGRVVEAQLLRTGVLTTTLCTGSGVLVMPNAALLRVPPA